MASQSIVYLFHDSPVRRDDYTTVTGSTVFPLKFCATRWIEDDRMAERALEIWPNVEKYIQHVLKEPKSKQPTSASFSTIEKATKDVIVPAKLQVFVYIAKVLKLFLVKYQTDEPIIMFLAEDLQSMCSKLMHKFVKKLFFRFSTYNVQNYTLGCTRYAESQSSNRDCHWLCSKGYPYNSCKKQSSE